MLWRSFLSSTLTKNPLGNIESCKNEYELMSLTLGNRHIQDLVSAWLNDQKTNKKTRSGKESKRLKEEGNAAFKKENYFQSVDLYTQSAKLAPFDTADFAIAIANRSAAFFYLQQYKKCLEDIAVAFDSNYPKNLHHKLHIRAAECHLKLGNRDLAKIQCSESLNLIKLLDKLSDKNREDLIQRVLDIEGLVLELPEEPENLDNAEVTAEKLLPPNPDFPSASQKVTLDYSPTRGRFVIAKSDIKPGDILFVEKPFAFVPLHHETTASPQYTVCSHCCGPIDTTAIPCRACTEICYCSKRCWTDSWINYHQWECLGCEMGIWGQIGITHLALRLLLVSATTSDTVTLNKIFELITHFEKQHTHDMVIFAMTASMITMFLERYTTFMSAVDFRACLANKLNKKLDIPDKISDIKGKRVFVSSLLLRYMLQLIINGYAITQLNLIDREDENVIEEQQRRVGVGIYPSTSMLNHSCDPSIMNTFWNDYIIMKAVKDIPAGTEIYNCYGPLYRKTRIEERQEILENQYFFTCHCSACTDPRKKHFAKIFEARKCMECSGPVISTVGKWSMKCFDCGARLPVLLSKNDRDELSLVCVNVTEKYKEYGDQQKLLIDLKTALRLRKKWLYWCCDYIAETLDRLAQVSIEVGRWADAILYLEESLAIIVEKFGETGIEVANELNKITDICIKYLQCEKQLTERKFKAMLKKTRGFLLRTKKIVDIIGGPWCRIYQEVSDKINILRDIENKINYRSN